MERNTDSEIVWCAEPFVVYGSPRPSSCRNHRTLNMKTRCVEASKARSTQSDCPLLRLQGKTISVGINAHKFSSDAYVLPY
jgi:hypothetical protein